MSDANSPKPIVFSRQGALFLDEKLKAAIVLKHGFDTAPETVNPAIKKYLNAGMSCRDAIDQPHGDEYLEYASEAYDILCDSGMKDFILLFEFKGHLTRRSDKSEIETEPGADLLVLTPYRREDLFSRAYADMAQLATEYAARLKPVIGDPGNLTDNIVDIAGTYWV